MAIVQAGLAGGVSPSISPALRPEVPLAERWNILRSGESLEASVPYCLRIER
jgi:hypothetical protein